MLTTSCCFRRWAPSLDGCFLIPMQSCLLAQTSYSAYRDSTEFSLFSKSITLKISNYSWRWVTFCHTDQPQHKYQLPDIILAPLMTPKQLWTVRTWTGDFWGCPLELRHRQWIVGSSGVGLLFLPLPHLIPSHDCSVGLGYDEFGDQVKFSKALSKVLWTVWIVFLVWQGTLSCHWELCCYERVCLFFNNV